MLKPILLFFILLISLLAIGQEPIGRQVIEQIIEEKSQQFEEETDLSEYIEILEFYLENPLNLNSCNEEELNELQLLNPFQIKSLLDYTRRQGAIVSIYELRLITGFTKDVIIRLKPFVYLGEPNERRKIKAANLLKYGRSSFISKASGSIQQPEGYKPEGEYPGNRLKLYNRYQYKYSRNVSGGVTMEKDPGEAFSFQNQPGFDYLSAHAAYHGSGILKTVVLGDFQANFAQGLILNSGYGGSKSAMVLNVMKTGKELKPYSSSDENNFFRGAGLSLNWNNFQLTTFASHHALDATVDSSLQSFSSFQISGIHATEKQQLQKHAITESTVGSRLSYQKGNFKLGSSGLFHQYNAPLETSSALHQKFNFSGSELWNVSIDGQYRFKALHLFAETALSSSTGKAILAGALWQLHSRLNAVVVHRNYEKNYQTRYGKGFGELSNTQNEKGTYLGVELLPVAGWKISSYIDVYSFPWLRYGVNAPSSGTEGFVQAEYVPGSQWNIYLRYKFEEKEENPSSASSSENIRPLVKASKNIVRLHFQYNPQRNLSISSRIESAYSNKEYSSNSKGYLLYFDVRWKTLQEKLSLSTRYTLFNTDNYESRIYAYESSVRFSYSVPAYYDKGSNVYLLLKYQATDFLNLEARISNTWYANKTEIGTGLNAIAGNQKTMVDLLISMKF